MKTKGSPQVSNLTNCSVFCSELALAIVAMRTSLTRAGVALLFLGSATRLGESFLLPGSRLTSAQQRPRHEQHRHRHDLPANTQPAAVTTTTVVLPLPPPRQRATSDALRALPADTSTEQQLPSAPGVMPAGVEEGDGDISGGAAQPPPPASKDKTRRGEALDGTPLAFRPPTTQDLHKLEMGDWVAQRGLAVALVAMALSDDDDDDATGEGPKAAAAEPIVGAPLAGAVVEAMDGVGGSSVATRVCLLRHRCEDGVSDAVEHALLDETINQFLNDGARISQVCV